MPAVEFDDGEKVLGSREIVRALEHRVPDPPLLPADRRERRAVEEAERWGDEVLQPLARRLAWAALVRSTGSMMGFAEDADLPVPDPLVKVTAPLVARVSAYFNGASDPAVRSDLINLDFHLDRADRLIETGAAGVSDRGAERRRPPDRLRRPAAAHDRGPDAAASRAARARRSRCGGSRAIRAGCPRGRSADVARRAGAGADLGLAGCRARNCAGWEVREPPDTSESALTLPEAE